MSFYSVSTLVLSENVYDRSGSTLFGHLECSVDLPWGPFENGLCRMQKCVSHAPRRPCKSASLFRGTAGICIQKGAQMKENNIAFSARTKASGEEEKVFFPAFKGCCYRPEGETADLIYV